LDRDLDEVLDRLPPELLRPPALPSVEPAFDRLPPLPLASVRPACERDEPDFARDEPPDLARDELDFARVEPDLDRDEPDRDEDDFARDEPEREPLDDCDLLVAELFDRELLDLPFDELLDDRRLDDRRRDEPPLRSAAGISSRATAFASCSICFSRNLAIRSSSRRMLRASLAVSLSPTVSASDSMPA
jgi:hypothetical protein